jgi:recombination protein RecA
MAKTNKQEIIKLCNEINKKEGEGSVYSIGSKHADLKISRWSTGIEDLDSIIGGGMPEGRVVEIFGLEGSGKTTLLYHLCGLHQLCLDIPIEGTFDAERAKVFGNRPKQMLIYRAKYGEDAFNKTIQFAKAGIPLIGIDSVPSMMPKDDAEKVLKSAEKDSIEELRIGGTARLITKYLPIVEEIIEVTGTTLIFINQVRDKMNAMMFGEKTDTPGGRKLKHACSLRIQVARKGWIEIPNKNPCNSATTEKIGLIMKCKVVKSKVSNPMGECEIPLIFDRGFVSFDDVPRIRKEIMNQRAVQYGKRVPKGFELDDEEDEDDEDK